VTRIENPGGVPVARVIDVARSLPGVQAVAASTAIPLGASGERVHVAVTANGDAAVATERAAIGPAFFPTLGVAMRAGRPFAATEVSEARTAIVNEALARRLFPGRSAVGTTVWIGNVSYDVVGLVADYANNPFRELNASPRIFVPLPDDPRRMTFLVRAADPDGLVQVLRREMRQAAIGNQVSGTYTLDEVRRASGQEMLVGTAPLFPLIGVGVLLTTAGIYGVLAFAVARRARELAVRVAIGASSQDLVRLITMHTLRLVATGATLGIGLTFGLSRVVRAAGGAGSVFDPPLSAFLVPIGVIVVIAVLATWLPTRRAAAIDPVKMLRTT